MNFDYDLVVIGAGSGGVRASRMAAAQGWKVAVIEANYLGGTCVNVGCVPKKLFVYGSEYASSVTAAKGYGIELELKNIHWPTLRDNKTNEIHRLNGIYNNLLVNAGVEVIRGFGRVTGANFVEVEAASEKRTLTAERILVATGGWPFKPEIEGAEYGFTSNEAFYLDKLPQRVVVVGGGYIAVEFAGIFNGLGCDTHLLYRGEQILRGFDSEVRQFAAQQIAGSGVHIHTQTEITQVEKQADGTLVCHLNDGSTLACDGLMFATGRRPLTRNIGLTEVGVALADNGNVLVNEFFQTSVPSIYALGDIIGTPELTPVALAQAMKLIAYWHKGDNRPLDYNNIPTAVFCQPNIGTVGLTEEQAREQFGDDVTVFASEFRGMKHTMTGLSIRTLMKLVVHTSTDKVLGAHMVGDDAGEIIQGLAVAIKAGATKAVFDSTLGIHPTAAEEFVTMRTARD